MEVYTADEKRAMRTQNPFDNRNVRTEFKEMTTEAIRGHMTSIAYPFVAICENLINDFNISQIVRSVNAFGLESVEICGSKKWDRRGAVGTHHYTQVNHHSDVLDAISLFRSRGYYVVAAEFDDSATSLFEFTWPRNVAVVFGEEGRGISNEALKAVDEIVYIPMRGTVNSFNVAGSAQMFMMKYVEQMS